MKVIVAILSLSTTLAAAAAVYVSTNRVRTAPVTQAPAAPVSQPIASTVQTSEVRSLPVRTTPEFVGRLAANGDFEVRAASNGSVQTARVDPGQFVEKGQTLLELENPTADASVRQAELAVDLAKSELENVQLQQANGGVRRGAMVGSGHGRFGRKTEQQARDQVTQAEATLARIKQSVGDTQIVAPVTGYVAERRVSVGDKITAGMAVLRIIDLSTLKLVPDSPADASQTIPADLRSAVVTFDSVPGRQFEGRVVQSLGGELASGHGGLAIEVANPDRLLKPGMAGHVRLVSDVYSDSRATSTGYAAARRNLRGPAETATDADLIRGMLVSLKGLATTLTVAADVQTKELTRKQEAAKVTVEASTKYFELLERELIDLRPDNNLHHAVNLEKAADQIDNLPILHVDEELVAFGAEVAQGLRKMAELRRSITRSRNNSDVTVTDAAQIENSAIRTQGMQRIQIGVANMRRKMTKKYNLEFVALATSMRNASAAKRRTAKH